MSSISFDEKRRSFLDNKYREMPELRNKDFDELFNDLVQDAR